MKRFSTNKDTVKENFGRQIRLFENLKKYGHDVDFFCPDYVLKENKIYTINGLKFYIVPANIFNPFFFLLNLRKLVKKNNYDLIAATTDPILGIMGYFFCKLYKIPYLYEVQDNYEIYGSSKIPFVKFLDKVAVKNSDFILYSNYSLKNKLLNIRNKNYAIIENGIDIELFKPINREKCRKDLKLKKNAKIITYIGHISRYKGVEVLLKAFRKMREKDKNLCLLLSGKIDKDMDIGTPGIIFREFLRRIEVVKALNASNVLVLPSTTNEFAKYCFPYKLFEYMACNVPIVATEVGDVGIILKRYKNSLCKPNNTDDLIKKTKSQLKNKKIDYRKTAKQFTWEKLSKKLERIAINTIK